MRNKGRLLLPAVLAVMLSGCQMTDEENKATVTPQPGRPVMSDTSEYLNPPTADQVKKQLETCLFEAQQLVKINGPKYQSTVNALYQQIRSAKYYASLAAHLSGSTSDTLTPMYQYRVNDSCNTISQSLLAELRNAAMVSGGDR